MDTPTLIQLLKDISWPGAIAVIALSLKPSLPILLSKFRTKNGENKVGATVTKQVAELQEFKTKAETNHFTDLKRLLRDNDQIWLAINSMRCDIQKNTEHIAWIRGKLGNGINN